MEILFKRKFKKKKNSNQNARDEPNGNIKINENGHGEFYGNVSLENNGGFSLLRYQSAFLKLKDYTEVFLRVKGDGKKYQFRIKDVVSNKHSFVSYFIMIVYYSFLFFFIIIFFLLFFLVLLLPVIFLLFCIVFILFIFVCFVDF